MKRQLAADVASVAEDLDGELGCMICDVQGGVWAAHAAHDRFPTASVIKVPVLVALACEVEAGRFAWDQKTPRGGRAAGGSGVVQYLSSLPFTLKDLATLMIIVSDNEATNTIIDLIGNERINGHFDRLGWRETLLARRMWDLDARARGDDNYSSPWDMAQVYGSVLRREAVSNETAELLIQILKGQQYRHMLPAWLPPDAEIAHKTGGPLGGTQNDCGILFTPGGPIIAAVFTRNVRRDPEGAAAIQRIGRAVWEAAR